MKRGDYTGFSGWALHNPKDVISGRQGDQRERETEEPMMLDLMKEEGATGKVCGQPLGACKGKRTDFPLSFQKESIPTDSLTSSVRLVLDFRPPVPLRQ